MFSFLFSFLFLPSYFLFRTWTQLPSTSLLQLNLNMPFSPLSSSSSQALPNLNWTRTCHRLHFLLLLKLTQSQVNLTHSFPQASAQPQLNSTKNPISAYHLALPLPPPPMLRPEATFATAITSAGSAANNGCWLAKVKGEGWLAAEFGFFFGLAGWAREWLRVGWCWPREWRRRCYGDGIVKERRYVSWFTICNCGVSAERISKGDSIYRTLILDFRSN